MVGITATPLLDEWQYWGPSTEEERAACPVEIKKEWGLRFGAFAPASLRKYGPINLFDSFCRLVTDGQLAVRCMLTNRKGRPGEFIWRVEWARNPASITPRPVHALAYRTDTMDKNVAALVKDGDEE